MHKFRVAIVGGGISGVCLAGALAKHPDIQLDLYEASDDFNEVGAGITLWGRVCDALRLMGLADDCVNAAVVAASTRGLPTTTGYNLRGFQQPDVDFGVLPFKDAWSMHRVELLHILLRRVPPTSIHLAKKLARYVDGAGAGAGADAEPVALEFADGTRATCDVLVGCDGIRSATRGQMMRHEAETTASDECLRYVDPRWSGTMVYRVLVPSARVAAVNPHHSALTGGQFYLGKNQHVTVYPISGGTKLNVLVSVTDLAKRDTRWPLPHWSKVVDRETFAADVAPLFADWDPEPRQLIACIDSAIDWAVHDLAPLPFYTRGRVVLLGDSAHAVLPYIGAGAAYAIEDAYALARILCARAATRGTLRAALAAFDAARRPCGNRLGALSRHVLAEFQYHGPSGGDMALLCGSVRKAFEEAAGAGGADAGPDAGPEADADKAVEWLRERAAGVR